MKDNQLADTLGTHAKRLETDSDLDALVEQIGDAEVVLLGEASHGTSEYYTWRARITRRLITEKGFSFIAVEGDWPDCERVNRFIRGLDGAHESARDALHAFNRWPTWMWANREMIGLVEWLRRHNDGVHPSMRVGFHGLDVYSLWESMEAVLEYLDRVDPEQARNARRAYGCFDPYEQDVQEYAMATRLVPTSCEDETVAMLRDLRRNAHAYREDGVASFFNAEQNALIARNAELYYRTMVRGGPGSWNVRDTHMIETLRRLHDHYGTTARSIVWEHNTHVGDARATDMAAVGMVNVGQLARDEWGEDAVAIVGFGSYQGTVIAGAEWGAPMEVMEVPPGRPGSWESVLHETLGADHIIYSRDLTGVGAAFERRGHRAIGVVYDPRLEARGNYVPTVLPSRYDAFIYLDITRALHPLHMAVQSDDEAPETFPSGM
jgi:erythromycin esterase-like protein